MVSKNKIKFIISLREKKIRNKEKLYIIEGDKLVNEFIAAGVTIRSLVATPGFIGSIPAGARDRIVEIITATDNELARISSLKTPKNAVAVAEMEESGNGTGYFFTNLSVALDSVQDPGNMGTIIRAAAWFGIRDIFCSQDCADMYNPKVIQSSMGAILHVAVHYTDIYNILASARERNIRVFGALLEGESVYNHELAENGIIILGNESKGISGKLLPLVTDKIMIPGSLVAAPGIESLNVGMAASVIFSEFRRRTRP
jgi:TrmH family RNA methyltransferase